MYIVYLWMFFFFVDIGYVFIMVLRIVKLGYLKRFSSKKSLIVVFKEYYFKLIDDIFFINY